MKKVLLLIVAVAFVLMGCVTTQPKVEVKAPIQQEAQLTQAEIDKLTIKPIEPLTKTDVAKILAVAISGIEKQGCKAMFLSERGGYIWAWCKDKTVRYYDVEPLVKKYRELKEEEGKDDTDNR